MVKQWVLGESNEKRWRQQGRT